MRLSDATFAFWVLSYSFAAGGALAHGMLGQWYACSFRLNRMLSY
jgi:hypothetical protein